MASRTIKTPYKYLSVLLMCLLFCPVLMGKEKEEFIQVAEGLDGWYSITLPKETPADTLLCGVFFAQDENARIFTLINVYTRLKEKKCTYQAILNAEKETEKALLEHMGTAAEAQMREVFKSTMESMYELYGHPSDFDTQEWSDKRLMTIKSSISKECGGGMLWGFSSIREPRHGLVAVSKKVAGKRQWGFMDMSGSLVVPCCYDVVLDFNNRRDWFSGGFDRRPDMDDRPWTVVRRGDRIGMIDNTGKIMVPIVFGLYQNSESMVFVKTSWGELAVAKDPSTKKHGIIDRQGNWVIQPKYEELMWEDSEKCFVAMTSIYDHGTWTGYDKKVIDLSH